MKLEDREGYKWAKYRWECLRRNTTLLSEVKKQLGTKAVAWLFLAPKRSDDWQSGNALRNALSQKNWEKLDPDLLSSDRSFEEIVSEIRVKNPGIPGEIMAYLLISPDNAVQHVALSKTKLRIEVNLDEVYSVDSLKTVVSAIIDSSYKAAIWRREMKPKKRPNMTDFDVILKVGDLKRQGRKNREIAKVVHPRKYATNPESAIRLVGYYYKRYKELVDGGGFLNLTYP